MLKEHSILLFNTSVVVGTTLVDFEIYLKLGLLLITIGYTIWKWYRDYRKS